MFKVGDVVVINSYEPKDAYSVWAGFEGVVMGVYDSYLRSKKVLKVKMPSINERDYYALVYNDQVTLATSLIREDFL